MRPSLPFLDFSTHPESRRSSLTTVECLPWVDPFLKKRDRENPAALLQQLLLDFHKTDSN